MKYSDETRFAEDVLVKTLNSVYEALGSATSSEDFYACSKKLRQAANECEMLYGALLTDERRNVPLEECRALSAQYQETKRRWLAEVRG